MKESSTHEELLAYLRVHGVSTSEWGKGGAKTTNHLFQELQAGETKILESDDGTLELYIETVNADIFYREPAGQLLHLKEDRQIFMDGRERTRPYLTASLNEKMKPNESADETLRRCLREELGVSIGDSGSFMFRQEEKRKPVSSYPGLSINLKMNVTGIYLTSDQYKEEGYTEKQIDKTTYFVWEKIS